MLGAEGSSSTQEGRTSAGWRLQAIGRRRAPFGC